MAASMLWDTCPKMITIADKSFKKQRLFRLCNGKNPVKTEGCWNNSWLLPFEFL